MCCGNKDNMKDYFKEFEYSNKGWRFSVHLSLFGREIDLKIKIDDENEEGILDVQKKAYETYLKNFDKYVKSVPECILDYYRWHYEEIKKVVALTEEGQRDNIVEDVLFRMIKVFYLFVNRDGSFGWLIGSSWIKEGFGVLLSEEEPRVITRDQLLNLHKLNDDTLGLLVHDGKNAWVGLEQNNFFGKDEDLRIELEGSLEEGITSAQQQAYEQYLEKKEDFFNELMRMMLGIYEGSDEKADDRLLSRQKILVMIILPKTLYIDKEGNYGWICYTQWNDSSIGLLLSKNKLFFLREDKLRNYRQEETMVDEVVGLLFHSYLGYENVVVVRLMDEIHTMPLVVSLSGDKEMDEESKTGMRKAYQTYLAMRPTFWNDIKSHMLYYYQENYEDFETYLEIPEELNKENVNEDNVVSILSFTELYIKGYNGQIAWLCESPTDEETGLGFEFTKGNIVLIGQDEII